MNTRQTAILELLSTNGEVAVQVLAERFGVSVMTIRRDLIALEDSGDLTRTHGGAILSKAGVIEFAFKEKERVQAAEKKAIGREAAALIQPGMTVTLDTGTTTLETARAMADCKNLTVLTSSLAIASLLYSYVNIELVLLGGMVRKGNPDLSGWITEENLKRFRVDMAFLGADGADPNGIYTTDVSIARVSQAIVAGAKETVLLLDHSKFDKTAFVQYAEWGQIQRLITDDGMDLRPRKWLKKTSTQITFAKV